MELSLIHILLHPRVALIAYASREGESFFVEAREIDGKGKMGEGVPVTVEFTFWKQPIWNGLVSALSHPIMSPSVWLTKMGS